MKTMKALGVLLASGICFSPITAFSQGPNLKDQQINEALKKASKYFLAVQDPKTGAINENVASPANRTTMTSIAILAMSAMGHQPADPSPEGKAMKRALDYVLLPQNQKPDGYFGDADGSRMYGHGITTLMLAEMLGMGADSKQDDLIRQRCRKGIDLILRAQRVPKNDANRGGWRYSPDAGDSDMSITCWQTMALRAAKNAGMDVPKDAIDLAVRYIKGLYHPGEKRPNNSNVNAGFGYAGVGNTLSTSAEGLLALQVCGEYESVEVKSVSDRLLMDGIKPTETWFFYTAYYYAQGMYQRGEKHAAAGKSEIANVMLPSQSSQGWWDARGGEEKGAGKVFTTSLAVLALAVKNHYLPIYQR